MTELFKRDLHESGRRGAKAMHENYSNKPDVFHRVVDVRASIRREDEERRRRERFN